jgi:hypothetical protein
MLKGDYINLSKHAIFKGYYIGDISKHTTFKDTI